jgi:hypothetical protein
MDYNYVTTDSPPLSVIQQKNSIIILQLPFPLPLTSSLSRCPIKRIIEQPTLGMIKNVKFLGNPLGMLLMSP